MIRQPNAPRVDPADTSRKDEAGITCSWFARYIGTYAGTIAGGTSEIQRNVIAQRVLGFPAR
jgi:hypothetical protein